MKNTIRTRFAPSPTGYLHVGAVRTALFAWLTAKQANGQFILRIEDTDKKREVNGAEQHIIDSLQALGLTPDESPLHGGEYGPYRQSERLSIYHDWAKELIARGRAYADPYTSEQVQSFREKAQQYKKPFLYRNHRPDNPPEWDSATPLRFRSEPKDYSWHDEVMGDKRSGPETIDDFILIKSDGYPTYNFAHIIDDMLMQITHVIRGQEFIASTPNYLNLYEALNIAPPKLATMPPIMGPDGRKKLSKRDGATNVLDYVRQGYAADSLISFIATLGWNDGTEQEIFTRKELIEKFSLDRVGRGGAIFDEKRLNWMNGQAIRKMSSNKLYEEGRTFLPKLAEKYNEAYNKRVLEVLQERLKYFAEIPELSEFFYETPEIDLKLIADHKKLKKLTNTELATLLNASYEALAKLDDFSIEPIAVMLNELLEQTQQKPVVLFSLIRIAITRAPASPGLAETIALLGKQTVLERVQQYCTALKTKD